MKKPDLFSKIFSDAQVLDVDFSKWDKYIQLCVVGLDVEYPIPDKLPIFIINFNAVSSFQCSFRHFDIQLDNDKNHFQWNIHELTRTKRPEGLEIKLVGAGVSPVLNIVCRDYEIIPLSHEVLHKLFPGWNKPYGPLVRPNITTLNLEKKRN